MSIYYRPGIGYLILNEAVVEKLQFRGRESQEYHHQTQSAAIVMPGNTEDHGSETDCSVWLWVMGGF